MSAVFEYGWREDHARAGDGALIEAERWMRSPPHDTHATIDLSFATAWSVIAQAHYAAANVRTRPVAGPAELRTKTPYVIPGVEGRWEIRGMATENFGATGNVELRLYRVGE